MGKKEKFERERGVRRRVLITGPRDPGTKRWGFGVHSPSPLSSPATGLENLCDFGNRLGPMSLHKAHWHPIWGVYVRLVKKGTTQG